MRASAEKVLFEFGFYVRVWVIYIPGIIRFEKHWKRILFCLIITFTVFIDGLCVIALKFFTCAFISVDSLLNEVDLHK